MAVLRRAGRFAQKKRDGGQDQPLLFSIGLLLRWLWPARGEGFESLISGVWESGRGAA
jgi:hypothetical protein